MLKNDDTDTEITEMALILKFPTSYYPKKALGTIYYATKHTNIG